MPRTVRWIGVLLACAFLTACQSGGGSGSAGATTGAVSDPAAPPPVGGSILQCQALTPQPAAAVVLPRPTAPAGTTVPATLVLAVTGTHSLGVYMRDPWTGALLDRGYVPTGPNPVAVAATPNGQYVYVANEGNGTVSAFAWSPQQARLLPLTAGASSVSAGSQPVALAIVGSTLYAADAGSGAIAAFAIGSGGQLTPLAQTSSPTLTALVAGTNTLFALNGSGVTVYSVTSGGGLRAVQTIALSGVLGGASGPSGSLYVLTSSGLSGYTAQGGTYVDASTVPLGAALAPAAVSVTGGYATVVGAQAGQTVILTLPVSGGQVSCPITAVSIPGSPSAVTGTPGGHSVYVAEQSRDDLAAFTAPSSSPNTLSALVRTRQAPAALASATTTVIANPALLYVDNQSSSTVATYAIASGGSLGAATTASTGTAAAAQGPSALALAPDGQTLYTSDWATASQGDVTAFSVGTGGALTNEGSVAAGISPIGVAVDPSNRYLYVANSCYVNSTATQPGSNCAEGNIQGYGIGAGGLLTSFGSEAALGDTYPMLLTIDPTGQYLYVSENAGQLIGAFGINADTGALTAIGSAPIGGEGSDPWTLVVGPSGRHLYAADNNSPGQVSIYRIDAGTGALTLTATLSVNADPLGLAMGPKGRRLYVATQGAGPAAPGSLTIFQRATLEAPSTSWSPIGTLTASSLTNPYGLAVSGGNQALYVINSCYGASSTNGSIVTLAIPPFADGQSLSAYTNLGVTATGACSVQAVAAGAIG
ncbi:MAG: beta-propeller fold lactonase family protein [Gammaproteobacteria bacterium]|nr:beta-propeller fold lactonase family protein [Gammaproteobacteria bacterium]